MWSRKWFHPGGRRENGR
uniref:Uncharacterized protein n=1 Tax=Arundo donax TaxID=35708 RepID=A0A0A8ZK11_ARUDO